MNRLPISVCMISGAEAHRIERSLASVADWTSEIIVVLNQEVNDGTEAICLKFGAKVFRESWQGYVAQKNSAANKATQPWVLGLDADEVISPELRDELKALFADPTRLQQCPAWRFPRCTFFCGRWIRHGDWYPDHQTRLWQRGQAHWGGIDPHDKIEVSGRVGALRSDLHHFSFDSINHQISKIGPYADLFVHHRLAENRRANWFEFVIRPQWRFWRAYVFRLGFLDGWPGYYIARANAFAALTRYAKVREAQLPAEPQRRL